MNMGSLGKLRQFITNFLLFLLVSTCMLLGLHLAALNTAYGSDVGVSASVVREIDITFSGVTLPPDNIIYIVNQGSGSEVGNFAADVDGDFFINIILAFSSEQVLCIYALDVGNNMSNVECFAISVENDVYVFSGIELIISEDPTDPVDPVDPVDPTDPVDPSDPSPTPEQPRPRVDRRPIIDIIRETEVFIPALPPIFQPPVADVEEDPTDEVIVEEEEEAFISKFVGLSYIDRFDRAQIDACDLLIITLALLNLALTITLLKKDKKSSPKS